MKTYDESDRCPACGKQPDERVAWCDQCCGGYQPVYMPNEENFPDEPIFKTKEEAWSYIIKKHCHCGMEVHLSKKDKHCISCEAEWEVDIV